MLEYLNYQLFDFTDLKNIQFSKDNLLIILNTFYFVDYYEDFEFLFDNIYNELVEKNGIGLLKTILTNLSIPINNKQQEMQLEIIKKLILLGPQVRSAQHYLLIKHELNYLSIHSTKTRIRVWGEYCVR